ncbi:MAG: DoxX family protein [Bacillota bacterium]
MQAESKKLFWTGAVLSGLAVLFFLFDGAMKLVKPLPVVQATVGLGYPEDVITGLGIVLLACTLLYALPRTAVLGAVLLTGYLGGAIASKVRIGAPTFDIAFALVFAAFVWGGLLLREPRLRALFPLRKGVSP